jgi:hypothetical protein
MARSIPVEIPPFSFASKAGAQEAVRAVLNQNRNRVLVGNDLLLAEAVLRAHPHAAQKLRSGYKGMSVAKDPERGTWCLWVHGENGEREDVSYQVALGITSSEPSLQRAGRQLLKDSMESRRKAAFAAGPVQCAVSGKPLNEGEAHVAVRRQHSWDRLGPFTKGGWLVHRSPQERR